MHGSLVRSIRWFVTGGLMVVLTACGSPEAPAPAEPAADAAPAAAGETADATTNVYFGDTHLHTALSVDAGTFGNRLGLDEAYRFTRGETVTASAAVGPDGKPMEAKLRRPLDWVVVADHSDAMGIFQMVLEEDPQIMQYEEGPRWSEMIKAGKMTDAASDLITNFSQGTLTFRTNDPELMKPVWEETVAAAEKYNEPGKFTAFIGYEWTSLVKGNNLHRNVIYRDNGEKALQTLPFTNADSSDPEDLWAAMEEYEATTGGQLLAIPHNGNLSNGMMFDVETLSGGPITKEYAEQRQKWEPLYESTQIKGDGETHPHPLL